MAFTRIKICGITSVADARAVVASGADAIGLNFYARSPRVVTADQALEIVAAVPPFVTVVGLFVDEPVAGIERILKVAPLDVLQFHGEESPEVCQQFGRPWIKALRMRTGVGISQQCSRYQGARGILLDSWQEGVPGGTGKTFDWQLAREKLSLPVVLAGGLHDKNVGDAIRALGPAAVDVCGGVESAPGIKDGARVRQFVAAVRAADEQLDGLENDE